MALPSSLRPSPTYCRRQGQPSKVPSVPNTFSELEVLGTEDLAAAVTDEERYTQIVRELMAASNVVQVGVWRQPDCSCMSCGLPLFLGAGQCVWANLSDDSLQRLGGARASQWHPAISL